VPKAEERKDTIDVVVGNSEVPRWFQAWWKVIRF
jgi:hypothetical protein